MPLPHYAFVRESVPGVRVIGGDETGCARALAEALVRGDARLRRRQMPGFDQLARRVVPLWAVQPGANGEITRLLRDLGRFAAGTWAFHLEASAGGLTVARLGQALRGAGISGAGRARTLLTYLRFIGYVEPAPDQGDGRDRRYRTTAKMRHAYRDRMRRELEARADLDPAIPAVLARFDAVCMDFLALLGEASLLEAGAPGPRPEEIDLFSERYAGFPVLCELVLGGDPDDVFPPRGGLTFNVAELARRCGTSWMQVATLLRKARAAGALLPAGDGRERLAEAVRDRLLDMVADTTNMIIGCARILEGRPLGFFDDPETPKA